MSKRQHILLLTPGFPADENADTCMPYFQVYLKEVLKSQHNLKFTIVTLHYPYKSATYHWNGITVHACGGKNKAFPMRFMYWRKAWKHISRVHKKNSIDFIHSLWLSECTVLAQRWSQVHKVNHIATAMGQDVLSSNRYLKHIDVSKLTSVAVSERQNKELTTATGAPADMVIPWGTPRIDLANSKRDIDVLGVGSLHELKAFDRFLRVIVKVIGKQPQLRITLIGDGPERKRLEELAENLGISSNVQFTGMLAHAEVIEIMQRSKVLLHTSGFESQGYVFAEALACGMSVVSTDVGSAAGSKHWSVCQTDEQLEECVISSLERESHSQPLVAAEATMQQYSELYTSL